MAGRILNVVFPDRNDNLQQADILEVRNAIRYIAPTFWPGEDPDKVANEVLPWINRADSGKHDGAFPPFCSDQVEFWVLCNRIGEGLRRVRKKEASRRQRG